MTKHATLKSKLHKSLTHLRPAAAPVAAATPKTSSEGIAQKLSVSLHPADLAKITAIQAELAKVGKYVTTSEALKVAVRGYEPTAKSVLALYESLKDTDQRRKD